MAFEILKSVENLYSKEFGPSEELKFIFLDNQSQNTLRLNYEIEK